VTRRGTAQFLANRSLERAVSIDGMGQKDANAKQTQDHRHRFNHFTHPYLRYRVRSIALACFKIVSLILRNGFVASDETASQRANNLAQTEAGEIELWQGARMVAALKPKGLHSGG
jgi:hypothetical protein